MIDVFEGTYESACPSATIHYYIWSDDEAGGKKPKGIVQLIHGMFEHMGYYDRFARFLVENGYIVCQNENLGHGKSASGEFGWFGERDGSRHLVDDAKRLTDIVRGRYPDCKVYIFGHSMGSFIARRYVALYPDSLEAVVFCGTCGPDPLYWLSSAYARLLIAFKGAKAKGKSIAALNSLLFNVRFRPRRTGFEWLTRDKAQMQGFCDDRLTQFVFTLGGYRDMFTLMLSVIRSECASSYPKGLPALLVSGREDPVGGYGKGVLKTYRQLLRNGVNAHIKLYDGARHALLQETNMAEVFRDVLGFLETGSLTDGVSRT
ncbi:MAG: alpha/beta hydrolase [Eubacteriaceae bacterium]|jgi:alpha-beta hydrolase superfamily lysophospholipase|nr:alpha/beta hydrolase [Eubacteriaceae bacterium]